MQQILGRSSEVCPQHSLTGFLIYEVIENGETKTQKECIKCLEEYEIQKMLIDEW